MGEGGEGGIRVLKKQASMTRVKNKNPTTAAYKFQEFGFKVFTLYKIDMADICVDTEFGAVQQIR